MHRRTDLWGPDGKHVILHFRSRMSFSLSNSMQPSPPTQTAFLTPASRKKKYLVPNPYIFIPFNAGPRICLGQQFAYNEASFMLVELLQTFSDIEIELDEAAQLVESKPPGWWKEVYEGKAKNEKVMLKTHLTLYAYVSASFFMSTEEVLKGPVQKGLWVRMKEATMEEVITSPV